MFCGRFEDFVAFGENPEEIFEGIERSIRDAGMMNADYPQDCADVEFFQCTRVGIIHRGWEFVVPEQDVMPDYD